MVEILGEMSIDKKQVISITKPPDWTKPYLDFLHQGILLEDLEEAKHLKIKSPQFTVKGMQLYKTGYLASWLTCISHDEGQTLLEESNFGEVGAHEKAWALIGKYFVLEYIVPAYTKKQPQLLKMPGMLGIRCIPEPASDNPDQH